MQSKFVLRFASQGMCSWKKGWHQHTSSRLLGGLYMAALHNSTGESSPLANTVYNSQVASIQAWTLVPKQYHNTFTTPTKTTPIITSIIIAHATHLPRYTSVSLQPVMHPWSRMRASIPAESTMLLSWKRARNDWMHLYVLAQLDQYHGKRWHREGNV